MLTIEVAGRDDLEQVLGIAAARRREYASYSPQFWRPAADAVARHREFLAALLEDDKTLLVLASENRDVRGFAVARLGEAPPVYDPGGLTCTVDDFAVVDPAEWSTVGPLLLDAVRAWASERGAVQLVVVVAHLDVGKRAVLEDDDLGLTSEWWVAPLRR